MSVAPSIEEIATQSRWATTVGKVCDQFGGEVQTGPFGSQLHASDYTDEGTPVVMPQDMSEGRIVCDRVARVGPKHVDQLKRHKLRVGDVVYSRRGDVTRFAVVTEAEEGWLCGTGSIRIRLNCPEIEIGYVRRYLQQEPVGNWLKHHAKGVTMPNLNTAVIRALPFVYPPLTEQRRITELLDRAEALRAKRCAALAQLDSLTQSLFLDLFGDPKSNPKGWPENPMTELFATSPIFGTMIPPVAERCGWLSLRVGNIQDWTLDLSDSKYVDLPAASVERHSVKDGDLLLARAIASQDHLGKCVIAHPNGKQWAFDSHLMRLRFNHNLAEPEFIRHLFMTPGGRSLFLKASRKSTVQFNINTKEISALRIPVPPIESQREFARSVTAVEKLKSAHRASLAELDALFASLQHRAFRGEL